MGKQSKQWQTWFSWAPKSLQMLTSTVKVENACSLEGKLWAVWKWKWSRSVLSDSLGPVDCSPPSSSIHGILQARILEWVAISFSRGSSRPRDRTQVSQIAGRRFNLCTTREAHEQCRQHNKKYRHYFPDKRLSSQSYGFSSSHVWIWEFNYKEGWASRNWCFWTVLLEKTLESLLDCKEITALHFFRRKSILNIRWKDWC